MKKNQVAYALKDKKTGEIIRSSDNFSDVLDSQETFECLFGKKYKIIKVRLIEIKK